MTTPAAPATSGIPGTRLLIALLGILLIAVSVIVLFSFLLRESDPELPVMGTIAPFELVDEGGQRFTEEALRGHPTIVDFVFTRCDEICPALSARLQQLAEKTADRKGASIKFLSITVDPEWDTPERLAAYASHFRSDPTRWKFLTGPRAKIEDLVFKSFLSPMDPNGMSKASTPGNAIPRITHAPYFLLVDGDLNIRGRYEAKDIASLDELHHHARYLARISKDERSYKFGGS